MRLLSEWEDMTNIVVMPVRIVKILDGSQAELEGRKYNIFVPISLGNLYFTKERVRELVLWALEHTRDCVAILICDNIHAINYEVLRRMNKRQSAAAARSLGDNKLNMAERIIRSLPREQRGRVLAVRWDDIEKDTFAETQNTLRGEYRTSIQFKAEVHRIVRVALKQKAPDDLKAINRLGDYVIAEMPLMLNGIYVRGKKYEVFLYPGLSELDALMSDIQNRRKFPDLAAKLKLTKRLLVEAYVE